MVRVFGGLKEALYFSTQILLEISVLILRNMLKSFMLLHSHHTNMPKLSQQISFTLVKQCFLNTTFFENLSLLSLPISVLPHIPQELLANRVNFTLILFFAGLGFVTMQHSGCTYRIIYAYLSLYESFRQW